MIDRPVVCARGAIPFAAAVATLRRWVHVAALDAPWRLAGFPFLFGATWLLAALLPAALLLPPIPAAVSASLVVSAIVARLLAADAIRRRLLGERVRVADLLVAEAVLLDAALRAGVAVLSGRELAWRDRRYRVARGGRIVSVRRAGA